MSSVVLILSIFEVCSEIFISGGIKASSSDQSGKFMAKSGNSRGDVLFDKYPLSKVVGMGKS